jgi:Spy/CpxP family protein refolding chaperone
MFNRYSESSFRDGPAEGADCAVRHILGRTTFMNRRIAIALLVLGSAVACSKSTEPVTPEVTQLQLDAVNPTNLTFAATNGLPTEPFHVAVGPTVSNAMAATAVFPDTLKLTTAQKESITSLRTAFETANKADLVSLKAIYEQASAANKAGKPAADVRAVLALSKPILARMAARFDTLKAAIAAVLTPAQRAWIAAHLIVTPPAGWMGPVGPATTTP